MSDVPQFITDQFGNTYRIGEKLSTGGEGAVYRITDRSDLIVKFVFSDRLEGKIMFSDKKMYVKNMSKIIHLAGRNCGERVTVPVAIVAGPYCGYIMRFMEGMKPLDSLLEEYRDNSTLDWHGKTQKRKILLLRSLAHILDGLHRKGLIYRDLSPANVFIPSDSEMHHVWLIDGDNISFRNEIKNQIYTPNYCAPEVYRGSSSTLFSDCYSFALIAFEVLTGTGPFDGEAMDEDEWDLDDVEPAEIRAQKGKLDYIFEPGGSNRRTKGLSPQTCMTEQIRKLFLQTFNAQGRSDPYSRPWMRDWVKAFSEAADIMTECRSGHHHFGQECPFCGEKDGENRKDKYLTLVCSRPVYILADGEKTFRTEFVREHEYRIRLEGTKYERITLPFYYGRKDNPEASMRFVFSEEKISVGIDIPYEIKMIKQTKSTDPLEICFSIYRKDNLRDKLIAECRMKEETDEQKRML